MKIVYREFSCIQRMRSQRPTSDKIIERTNQPRSACEKCNSIRWFPKLSAWKITISLDFSHIQARGVNNNEQQNYSSPRRHGKILMPFRQDNFPILVEVSLNSCINVLKTSLAQPIKVYLPCAPCVHQNKSVASVGENIEVTFLSPRAHTDTSRWQAKSPAPLNL